MSTFINEAQTAPTRLRGAFAIRMALAGVAGWALAALFIRYANRTGLFQGAPEAGLFALCFPIAWATARLLRRRGRVPPDQIVPGMAIGLVAALFLDGVALTTAPSIYGAPQSALLPAAAWLLFGVGAFLAAAFLEARRDIAAA